MSNYLNLQEAIDAMYTNMTKLRDNDPQDDGTDTVDVDVDWFYYNGKQVKTLYVSGNSWIGFGENSEHLKINRRDCKMYYLFKETGYIGNTKFFKIRWQGYSNYSSTSDSYLQVYDVFLFDTGKILLVWNNIPNSNFNGTNTLTYGSTDMTYTVKTSTGYNNQITFAPSSNGTSWTWYAGIPLFANYFKLNGAVEFSFTNLKNITKVISSMISWNSIEFEGTSIKVYSKINNQEYSECTNGDSISSIEDGANLSESILYIKVELTTTYSGVSPILNSININIRDITDNKVLKLLFKSGKNNSIRNAVGDVNISYAGGTLAGNAGKVNSFEKSFTPTGLVPLNNPHVIDHIEVPNISVSGTLSNVSYIKEYGKENVHITNIQAIGTLTHVNDI